MSPFCDLILGFVSTKHQLFYSLKVLAFECFIQSCVPGILKYFTSLYLFDILFYGSYVILLPPCCQNDKIGAV